MSNERTLSQSFSWDAMKFFIELESKQSRREKNYLATVEAKMTIIQLHSEEGMWRKRFLSGIC